MKKTKKEEIVAAEKNSATEPQEQVASSVSPEQTNAKSEKELEKERVKKEKKEWNYNRKVKRGFKALRGRKIKNFMFWLAGVVSGLVILASTVLVAVGVVPFKTYFGDQPEESISKEVGDKSLLAIAMGFKAYTESYSSITEAFPIIDKKLKEALSQVDGYVQLDIDSIKDVSFTDPTFGDKLMSSIKITATLESVGASSMLGDFASLPLFKDDPAINTETGVQYTVATVDTTTDTFDYRLYTYYDNATSKYVSASNKDATDWAESIKGTNAPLYYASLLTMPFSDITQFINERLGVIQVADLVESFSAGAKDGLIGDILGNTTIATMGSFDPQNIEVSVLIDRFVKDADGNDTEVETDLYQMLRNILGIEESESIKVAHFNENLNLDEIKISLFLDRFVKDADGNDTTTETETYAMLRSILSVPEGEEITVKHLTSGLDFDSLKLSTFIDRFVKDADGNPTTEETEMYSLLRSVFNVPAGDEILVSHLTSGTISFDTIKLSTFIDRFVKDADGNPTTEETEMYSLLRTVFNVPAGDEILVSHLTSGTISFDNVKLSDFIERFTKDADGNPTTEETEMYSLLRTVFNVPASEEILISHLTNGTVSFDNVKLSDFIERFTKDEDGNDTTTETEMYSLLRTVFNVPAGEEILISHLTNGTVSFNNVKLSDFIDRFESDGVTETEMYKLLRTVFNVPAGEEILVSHLTGTMTFDNVNLSDFIDRFVKDAEGNDTATETEMYKLLRTLFGVEEGEIKVSDLNKEINFDGVKLSDFIDRFVKDVDGNDTTEETEMYKLLRTIFNVPNGEEILVSHLTGTMSFDNVNLSDFIDRFVKDPEGNETTTETEMYKLLRTLFGVEEGEIKVSDLNKEINFDGVKLSDFIDRFVKDADGNDTTEETQIYKLLRTMFGVTEGEIKVSDLQKEIQFEGLNISDFIDRYVEGSTTEETEQYKLLRKISGVQTGEITIADLKAGLSSGIKLSAFIDRYEDDDVTETKFFTIIRTLFNVQSEEIYLDDLNGEIAFDSLDISNIIDQYEEDGQTETGAFDMLRKISGVQTGVITVADLKAGLSGGIKLSAFIDRYEDDDETETKFFTIIRTLFNVQSEEIYLDDLNGEIAFDSLDISNIIDQYEEDGQTETSAFDMLRKISGKESGVITVADLKAGLSGGIKLSSFIDRYEDDDVTETKFFKTIRKLFGITGNDEIYLDDLNGDINFEDVEISEFIDRFELDDVTETKTYKLLRTVFGVSGTDEIKVSDLKNEINFDGVNLSDFIDQYETIDGEKVETSAYKLLRKLTGVKEGEIKVSQLKDTLNTGINLSAFVTRYETVDGVETTTETQIYRIIRSAFGVPSDRDITVDDLGGTFNIDNVSLSDFIDQSSKIYQIILSATGKNAGDEVKLSEISNLSVNDCEISLFIPRGENENIYKIIEEVIVGDLDKDGNPVFDEDGKPIIRVKHLANFEIDKLKLESVIDRYTVNGDGEKVETDLFKILGSVITGTGANGEILVKDISSFDVNEVKLSTVIDKTANASLYDILEQAVKGTGADGEILVKDLRNFTLNDLEVAKLIDTEGKLYEIICNSVTGTGENGAILVGDLSSFETKNIKMKLSDVIDRYQKDQDGNYILVDGEKVETNLFRILSNAVTGTGENGEIMISDLSSFEVGNLPLSEVVDEDSKLYEIMLETVEGTGKNGAIIVSDLKNFKVTELRLSTVIDETDNNILKKLIEDDSVTIANLGDKINNIELQTIFEIECFTTDPSKAAIFADSNMGKYRKVVKPQEDCHMYDEDECICEQYVLATYELDLSKGERYVDDNIYYVKKDAQIWLFMYYNDDDNDDGIVSNDDFNADGFAKSYKPMHLSFGNLQEKVAIMSDEIKHATIRQLVCSGLMDASPIFENVGTMYIYAQTVNDAISRK